MGALCINQFIAVRPEKPPASTRLLMTSLVPEHIQTVQSKPRLLHGLFSLYRSILMFLSEEKNILEAVGCCDRPPTGPPSISPSGIPDVVLLFFPHVCKVDDCLAYLNVILRGRLQYIRNAF